MSLENERKIKERRDRDMSELRKRAKRERNKRLIHEKETMK